MSTIKDSVQNPLIRRMRLKIIGITMVIITLILVISFSTICYVNYHQNLTTLQNSLESTLSHIDISAGNPSNSNPATQELSSIDATDTADPSKQIAPPTDNYSSASTQQFDSQQNNQRQTIDQSDIQAPKIGGHENSDSSIPVAVFSKSTNGVISSEPNFSNASISQDDLTSAFSELETNQDFQGFLSDVGLYYSTRTIGSTTYYAFADESSVDSWKTLLFQLLGVGIVTEICLLLIVILLSRWIIRPIEDAWNSQQTFIANASHELKTPLTVILANLSIFKAHTQDSLKDEMQWIESTETEALRMQSLVGELLTVAKNDSQEEIVRSKSTFTEINLSETLQKCLLQFESVAFDRGLTIDYDIQDKLILSGNESKLSQLFTILLDNACKYCTDKGTIYSTLSKTSKGIEFCLYNSSPILSDQTISQLFNRFYRGDTSHNKSIEGFGLGLSIAQQIIDEHNAHITVENCSIGQIPENAICFNILFQ